MNHKGWHVVKPQHNQWGRRGLWGGDKIRRMRKHGPIMKSHSVTKHESASYSKTSHRLQDETWTSHRLNVRQSMDCDKTLALIKCLWISTGGIINLYSNRGDIFHCLWKCICRYHVSRLYIKLFLDMKCLWQINGNDRSFCDCKHR